MTAVPAAPAHSTGTAAPAVESGTRLRRIASGSAIVGAGVITLTGFLTAPWEGGSSEAGYLHSLTGHPGQAMLSMNLLHFGYLLLVPTAFVLARLARHRAPVLAGIGLVLAVLGSGFSALVLTDAYDLAIAQHVPLADALRIEDGMPVAGFLGVGVTSAIGTILGSVLLMVALWRARWTSWLAAIATLAGWAVAWGAHDMIRGCSGAALVTIALVAVGIQVLRASDEQFAAGVRG